MRLSASHVYSAAPHVIFGVLNDPEFRKYAAKFMGAEEADAVGDRLVARMEAPPEIRGLSGPELTLEQVISWRPENPDGSHTGDLSVTLVGVPITLSGMVHLGPDPAGTRVEYSGDLNGQIPIMGRFIAQKAEPFIIEALDTQRQAAVYWLSR